MPPGLAPSLEAWGNFYVIVGSSAGALTGLQFVVMTLIAQTDMARGRGESISAFGTPNVVHFCAALPVMAYLVLLVAGLALGHGLGHGPGGAMLAIGAAVLLLVFIGIHNAWDTVTFVTMRSGAQRREDRGKGATPEPADSASTPS